MSEDKLSAGADWLGADAREQHGQGGDSAGWFWHCLARETGRIGHLYSPGAQRGPWPWFPYALDNGVFPLWNPTDNSFDEARWLASGVVAWRQLLFWSKAAPIAPMWAVVPDRPGEREGTLKKWSIYAPEVRATGIALAVAVQNGMTPDDVRALAPLPDVICVGGDDAFKWGTVEMWAKEFQRVHVLRCNSPDKLSYLQQLGVESTDGTGWNRGDRKQTSGLEKFARGLLHQHRFDLWPHVCRQKADKKQMEFA